MITRAGIRPEDKLTQRELEVLDAVMDGLSNAEVSLKFNVKENTTKRHLGNIFDKFGVFSRYELFARVMSTKVKSLHEEEMRPLRTEVAQLKAQVAMYQRMFLHERKKKERRRLKKHETDLQNSCAAAGARVH